MQNINHININCNPIWPLATFSNLLGDAQYHTGIVPTLHCLSHQLASTTPNTLTQFLMIAYIRLFCVAPCSECLEILGITDEIRQAPAF